MPVESMGSQATLEELWKAVDADPEHREPYRHLVRGLRRAAQWKALASALKDEASKACRTDEERVEVLLELAGVCRDQLKDVALLLHALEAVVALRPTNVFVLDQLAAQYRASQRWPELVTTLERKAEAVTDSNAKAAIELEIAGLRADKLGDQVGNWEEAFAREPDDAQIAARLRETYVKRQAWDKLLQLERSIVARMPTPAERITRCTTLVTFLTKGAKRPELCVDLWEDILAVDPRHEEALGALERLFAQSAQWRALAGVYARQAEIATRPEQRHLRWRKLARLTELKLDDRPAAIAVWHQILAEAPDDPHAPVALQRLLPSAPAPQPPPEPLEPIEPAAPSPDPLLQLEAIDQIEDAALPSFLGALVAHTSEATAQAQTLRLAGDRLEHSARPYGALLAHGRAFKCDPRDETSVARLERLADQLGAWEAVAEIYRDVIAGRLPLPAQVALRCRLGDVYRDRLGQAERALASYQRVLDLDPKNLAALQGQDVVLEHLGRWPELAVVLRRQLSLLTGDAHSTTLRFRLGGLLEQHLDDLAGALASYRENLSLDPLHQDSATALAAIFAQAPNRGELGALLESSLRATERWELLLAIHTVQLADLTDPLRRRELRSTMAALAETKLPAPQGAQRAFALWCEVLSEEPLSAMAIAEVERLAERTGQWARLVEIYGELNGHAGPDVLRLLRMARIYEQALAQPALAEHAFRTVLTIAPAQAEALAALDRIYGATGRIVEQTQILEQRLAAAIDPQVIFDCAVRLGDLQAGTPGMALAAIATYERGLALASDRVEQIDLAARIARLSSQHDDVDLAIGLWRRVLDLRPDDREALTALGDLLQQAQRWSELVEVVRELLHLASGPDEELALLFRQAQLWAQLADSEQDAIVTWRRIAALIPGQPDAQRALIALYRTTRQWTELSVALRASIDVLETEPDPARRDEPSLIALLAELASVEDQALGRPDEAIAAWRAVLHSAPTHEPALAALEALFTRQAMWAECANVLEYRASLIGDPPPIELWQQAACLWDERVGDRAHAAELYEAIRRAQPSNGVASVQLETIYRALGRWSNVVDVLQARLELVEDKLDRVTLRLRIAEIHEEQLADLGAAFAVLRTALQEDCFPDALVDKIQALAAVFEEWDLLFALAGALEIVDPGRSVDLWLRISTECQTVGRVDLAIEALEAVSRLDPQRSEVTETLAALHHRLRAIEVIESVRRDIATEADPGRRAELYVVLGRQIEVELDEPRAAIAAYRSALELEPSSTRALRALERLEGDQS